MAASNFDNSSVVSDENASVEGESSTSSNEAGPSKRSIDGPRIAQWEDDDEDSFVVAPPIPLKSKKRSLEQPVEDLQDDLSSLPYSTLLKARRLLATAVANDSESGTETDEDSPEYADNDRADQNNVDEQQESSKRTVEKRKNKHAPVEMTSKRAVSRRRTVVEVKKVTHRDPRFSDVAGELSAEKFRSQYSFLSDLHLSELSSLKDNLKRAEKMLRSSPRELREEREKEVERLERAVKRAESTVNRDKLAKVEQKALEKVKKEEREKREKGKSGWWLKDSAKKDILLKARHDALAESGGKGAVKKAIAKRQKKIVQKEKRSLPSFASRASQTPAAGNSSRTNKSGELTGPRSNKRRRIS